jgi:predicted TIM-barrel fold metal-dependent hydrolase
MHLDGISHAVLFPTEAMAFGCIADPRAAKAMSRAYNDWLGEYCSADPVHLKHVAHVPFGNVPDAVAELQRAKQQYDSVGVYVRPNPYPPYESGGKFASDPRNEEFWAVAEDLGVTVCFHEAALLVFPTPGLDRFGPEEYYLIHAGAHPIGQIMAMLEMMGTGVMDRHPNLRVGFLEAGCGWVPSWLHRFDEHVEDWAGGERLSRLPSEQFRDQAFVTTEGDEVGLELFMSMYPDNVLFASDYPHADCTFPGAPDGLLAAESLTDEQKRAILSDNTARWFGVGVPTGVG